MEEIGDSKLTTILIYYRIHILWVTAKVKNFHRIIEMLNFNIKINNNNNNTFLSK